MNFIETFGKTIKPKLTKGKNMWKPLENGFQFDNIYSIRDKDVNMFLIKYDDKYIAIDSGYKNSKWILKGLKDLKIDPSKITHVLITHLDIDHAGGVDKNSYNLFPNAKIYIGIEEERYLTKEYYRKKLLFYKCKLPISLRGGYLTLKNNRIIKIGDIELKAVLTPGHTLGHTSYIYNSKYLFSGDTIIASEDGGYCFYDFWNSNSEMNKNSIYKLKEICERNNISTVITSHSGIVNAEKAFRYYNYSPNWREKNFSFIKDADFNPYI